MPAGGPCAVGVRSGAGARVYSITAFETMSMRKRILAIATLPVIGLGVLGANMASAHGWGPFMGTATPEEIATHQQSMFQEQATLLGISADDLKQKWAEGKDLREIAADLGISDEQLKEKMKSVHQERMRTHLQALVDKGVITQAQADQRLAAVQVRLKDGSRGRGGMRGMHPGGPF